MEISGNNGVDLLRIQEKSREIREKAESQKAGRKTSNDKSTESGEARGNTGVDQVHISSRARDARKIRAKIDAAPDVRVAKVEEIKTAIAQGKYHVDAKDIADKILREHFLDFFS